MDHQPVEPVIPRRLPAGAERHFATCDDLCAFLAKFNDTAILGFSAGKDSIGCWLQLRRHFRRVVPFYLYYVPGISFIEDSLAYYEDFFGCRIARFPHPALFNIIDNFIYQPPERKTLFDELKIHRDLKVSHIVEYLRHDAPHALLAEGAKISDSLRRALTIKAHGSLYPHKHKFLPIFDWNDARLERELRDAKVKLPADYLMFVRTWEGARFAQMEPLREHSPADYAQLLRWMPLSELEFVRRRFADEEREHERADEPIA